MRDMTLEDITVNVFTFMSGGRTGQSMFEKMKEKIPARQDECGAAVAFQLDPFAVASVTPVMQRAHSADFASNICFVDSTASCNADNHVLTFLFDFNCSWSYTIRCCYHQQHFQRIVQSQLYVTEISPALSVVRWAWLSISFPYR